MNRWRRLSGLGVLVALSLVGCAMETAEDSSLDDALTKEQADTRVEHTVVYAFDKGLWRLYEFLDDDTARPANPKRESWFGMEGDRPLLGNEQATVIIGVYGKYADPTRRGKFYFDVNDNGTWDAGDYGKKFLPASVGVQEGDQPFVLYGQQWGKDASGKCVRKTFGADPWIFPLPTRMVGIQRGTQMFLDRDGDGVFKVIGGCDLFTDGQFGAPDDVRIAAASGYWNFTAYATVRVVGDRLNWFFDEDDDLAWYQPPDDASEGFGTSDMKVPPSHPGGISVSSGRTVHFDADGNRYWTDGDRSYVNVLPGTSWQLVGVHNWGEWL